MNWVVVVPIDSFEEDHFAVNEHIPVGDLDSTKPNFVFQLLDDPPISELAHCEEVQVWGLRGPLLRVTDSKLGL